MDLLKEGVQFRPILPDKCKHIIHLQTFSKAIVPEFIKTDRKSHEENRIANVAQYIGFVRLVIVSDEELIDYKWSRNVEMPVAVAINEDFSILTASAFYFRRLRELTQNVQQKSSNHFVNIRKSSLHWCSHILNWTCFAGNTRNIKSHR